jgi:hypothetical protein
MADTVKGFLAGYSAEVRRIAQTARRLIRKEVPKIEEQVDRPARIIGYGFGPRYDDSICVLMPTKVGVNVGFYRAVELPDPNGILQGTGKLHRHVKLKSTADVESPALRAMLRAALAAYRKRSNG